MSKKQSQEYRGNGQHDWEIVAEDINGETDRLRVPGGWLYRMFTTHVDDDGLNVEGAVNTVFVPMPEAVKHYV